MRDGLYDQLLTERLQAALSAAHDRLVQKSSLEDGDAHRRLAHFLADEIERVLREQGDASEQARFANSLLAFLREHAPRSEPDTLAIPPELLLAISAGAAPERPATPLAVSTLLARPGRPELGHELACEMASADRVDALIAFVTASGMRRLSSALGDRANRGVPLRLITTTYTGATDADALRRLALLPNTQVRVSYDGRRSRLHAKAWLFHRESGFSTTYVGSANVSASALGSGLEWMMKASEADLRHVIDLFRGAFDSLWADEEFESFEPERDMKRLGEALRTARGGGPRGARPTVPLFFTLRPYPFQQVILDDLQEQRDCLGRRRSLIVAATGTGKTLIAAFDFERQKPRPRLLFLAHRREILEQARQAFRHVLRDESFGELLAGDESPASVDHLFATVQSFLTRDLLARHGPEYWPFVVLDECHHLPAPSYRTIMERLRPSTLLGLTATPERTDNQSLLPDFEGHVAAEIRLWHAIERQLVVPFEYYGIADGTDLGQVEWTRGTYAANALDALYTGNDRRAELIAAKYAQHAGGRALGFCVSVAHAEFMARKFREAGIPSLAVHGGTSEVDRRAAPGRLRDREVSVLFTCDLYNEGVDLPFVDTLLLLRPTASATLFLQQLGRGLRLEDGKSSCLALDFIGQHRKEFRFDRLLTAMTGIPRGHLREAVDDGFPVLPAGCQILLDRVSSEAILQNLKASIGGGQKRLTEEVRAAGPVQLAEFLDKTGREVEDVYAAGGWTTLRRLAGHLPRGNQEEADLNRKFKKLLHLDDPDRINLLRTLESGRLVHGIGYQLFHEPKDTFGPAEWVARLSPELREELGELADVLALRSHPTRPSTIRDDWPLSLHRSYERREILTVVGYWTASRKPSSREGVVRLNDEKTELLFVTLDKSGKRFSPTTSYEDYAIDPWHFHWQSQSTTREDSDAGRRYAEQATNGWSFQLFVRPTIQDPFLVFGPCVYESHSGSRPMSITWRLQHEIPAAVFQVCATLLAA